MIRLDKKYIKPVSLMLSRAFKDGMTDIFRDPKERRKKTCFVHEFYLLRDYSCSIVFATSLQLEGVAVWMHSDQKKRRPFWRLLTSGAIWPAIIIGIKAIRKLSGFDRYRESKHEELMPDRHWYLSCLAVDPQYQGQKYASRLLKQMLARIDKEGLPCYLETEGRRNVSIYQRFGFEVVDEFVIPGTKDKSIAMRRNPKLNNGI